MKYPLKQIVFLLFALIIILVSEYDALGGNSVPLKPAQGKMIPIVVNGKEKEYYLVSKSTPIKLNVEGPAKIEVTTRLCLPKHHNTAEKYSIKVIEGSNIIKLYSTSTDKSEASFKGNDMIPGKSRKFSLDVPAGTHTFNLLLDNTNMTDAALRFSVAGRKSSGSDKRQITLEPLSYDRVVTAVVKENLISYYVSSKEKNVQLRVIGPTRLQITARLNFDAKMKGEQTYVLVIIESQHKVLSKPLSTTKSLGIIYQEWKDVVPGKTDKIYFDVPRGEHVYKFILDETVAHSVSLKFSIPTKDLSNEG